MRKYLTFLFVIYCNLTLLVSLLDPCLDAVILGSIQQRVVGYSVANDERYISDYRLYKAWYKLPPGYTLANSSEPCGTVYNWWLNDTLPNTGSALLTVCLNCRGIECQQSKEINVTSCSQGHVYELTPPDAALEAYCIVGKGETKAEAAPNISSLQPVISAQIRKDVNNDNRLDFYCSLDFSLDVNYTTLLYDFEWNLNSGASKLTALLVVKNVSYTNETDFLNRSKLTEEQLISKNITKPGFTISCSVKARKSSYGYDSRTVDSQPKFFGIKINTTTPIRVVQDDIVPIRFELTVPFGCFVPGCLLELHMLVPNSDSECLLSDLVHTPSLDGRSCGIYFKSVNEITTFELSAQIGTNQGTQTERVYNLMFTTPSLSHNHPFFARYVLPSIRVELEVDQSILPDKQCSSVSDPHYTTFDGKRYDDQSEGTFVLYRHKTLPVEVQTKTKSCNRNRAYCNCGVTVRAGRDIFQVYNCDGIDSPRFVLCEDGVLQRKIRRNGNIYQIELPNGARVELQLHREIFVNVRILPSLVDFQATEGLCGYFDNDTNNDLQARQGSGDETFANSWRVLDEEDLFNHTNFEALSQWSEELSFCTCSNPGNNNGNLLNSTTCSSSRSCTADTGNINEDICYYQVKRKKRDVNGILYDWYKDPATAFKSSFNRRVQAKKHSIRKRQSSYTEETARADCLNLMNITVFQKCDSIPDLNIDNFIDFCVLDALITNSMEWTLQHLESIKGTCIHHVEVMQPLPPEVRDLLVVLPDRNSVYNETYEYPTLPPATESPSSNPITKELLQTIIALACPNECSGNGHCINGTCKCDEPYFNFDCSIEKTRAPIMIGIPDKGECDLQTRSCAKTSVFGQNIAESSSLTCKTTHFTIDRESDIHIGQSVDVPGHYESMNEIYCPLSESRRSSDEENDTLDDIIAYGYQVSFSNDGILFSEADTIVIYDSLCLNCTKIDGDIVCTTKDGYCLNSGHCYIPGEFIGCYTCSSGSDKWTAGPDCPSMMVEDGAEFKVWMIGVICGVVVAVLIVVSIVCYIKKRKAKKYACKNDDKCSHHVYTKQEGN
ncbi:hypothetical protein ACF0H5_020013 [Mactra antiquata]